MDWPHLVSHKRERRCLQAASYNGPKSKLVGWSKRWFTVVGQLPHGVREPNGAAYFRYYSGKEISDYANSFYTRLGVNIFVHALTN